MLRAKALKRGGDALGASQAMNDARALDLQDRFLNWKAAKYMLRAGKIEAAISILGLFTKVFICASTEKRSGATVFLSERCTLSKF